MVVIFSCYLPKPLFADSLRVGFYFDVLLSLKSLVLLLAPVIFGVLWREGGREKKIDVVIINVFSWIMKSHSSLKMRNHGNLDNPSYTYYIYLTMCKVHLVEEKLSIKKREEKAFTFYMTIFKSQLLHTNTLGLAAL